VDLVAPPLSTGCEQRSLRSELDPAWSSTTATLTGRRSALGWWCLPGYVFHRAECAARWAADQASDTSWSTDERLGFQPSAVVARSMDMTTRLASGPAGR
jgi:hypothetical protein